MNTGKYEHVTCRSSRINLIKMLLSNEELSRDDRECIAYELACESITEVVLLNICKKIWIQAKPGMLNITKAEKDLLTSVFSRNRTGPKGPTDAVIWAAILYDVIKEKHKEAYSAYEEVGEQISRLFGATYDAETIRRYIVRGKKFLKNETDIYNEFHDEMQSVVDAELHENMVIAALKEISEPLPIETYMNHE